MKIIGHRGAKGLASENTLQSVEVAFELGVDELEIDVRLTTDGVIILNHDGSLQRTTGHKVKVTELTYEQLMSLDPGLTRLDEVIDFLDGKKPLRIEVKPGTPTQPIITFLTERIENGLDSRQLAFASFSQKTLEELHHGLPQIKTIVNEHYSILRAIQRCKKVNSKTICIHHRFIWAGTIAFAKQKGYSIEPYPLNNPNKARRWEKYGMKALYTDYPDRYLKPNGSM